jgi:laccase
MFEYSDAPSSASPSTPSFPDNTTLAPLDQYVSNLKAFGKSVRAFPKKVDKDFLYALGIAWVDCISPEPCVQKFMGMIQNITFDPPQHTNILKAYIRREKGVYRTDFPDRMPSLDVDLTQTDPHYRNGTRGTRVRELKFGDNVRIVFQNVQANGILDHPMHLHGHDFGVIGRGYGLYDPVEDPKSFNLVNPPLYNTFDVPNGGWLAIQFRANNPGVWLLHCHFDQHSSAWGMEMAFITRNGKGRRRRVLRSPHPLPKCL